MTEIFKFTIDSRLAFIQTIEQLSLEELNKIPEGFNNNIIWNFGHIVVSTPILCYIRTGIFANIDSTPFVDIYKKGTKPTYFVDQQEVDILKKEAISSIELLQEDYESGNMNKIDTFETSTFHSTLNTIEDVIVTCAGHDNLHYGYALAINKILKTT